MEKIIRSFEIFFELIAKNILDLVYGWTIIGVFIMLPVILFGLIMSFDIRYICSTICTSSSFVIYLLVVYTIIYLILRGFKILNKRFDWYFPLFYCAINCAFCFWIYPLLRFFFLYHILLFVSIFSILVICFLRRKKVVSNIDKYLYVLFLFFLPTTYANLNNEFFVLPWAISINFLGFYKDNFTDLR